MMLFSSAHDAHSHRVRLVLAEKGIDIDIVEVDPLAPPAELAELNPYRSVPTLVDRDLTLYDSRVVVEYLDERFPHPPLMPVDPVTRAHFRLALYRIERDWYGLVRRIGQETDKRQGARYRKALHDSIMATADVFKARPFFLSDEFSLVDASIAPILWRLPYYDIDVHAPAVIKYANQIFARPSFRASLSAAEQEMR
jgi:RNA polymerase-associated protein